MTILLPVYVTQGDPQIAWIGKPETSLHRLYHFAIGATKSGMSKLHRVQETTLKGSGGWSVPSDLQLVDPMASITEAWKQWCETNSFNPVATS